MFVDGACAGGGGGKLRVPFVFPQSQRCVVGVLVCFLLVLAKLARASFRPIMHRTSKAARTDAAEGASTAEATSARVRLTGGQAYPDGQIELWTSGTLCDATVRRLRSFRCARCARQLWLHAQLADVKSRQLIARKEP